MRAVVCRELGPLEQGIAVDDMPEPEAGPCTVVLRVEAAGANFVDALMARGGYQMRPPVPYVPGGEVAGTVESVGEGVTSLRPGERVAALCGFGGFAEKARVPAGLTLPVPESVSPGVAATFIQAYCTADFALHHRGHHQPGESVLVLGGAGGIGLAAIDIARSCGSRVVATGSTAEKRAIAAAGGADVVLDPGPDLKERVREETGGGADVVVDPVGGELAEPALRSLREGGRYLVIGFASGTIPRLPLNLVLLRNRTLLGIDWGAWSFGHPAEQGALARKLLEMVGGGRLRPPEPALRPLPDAVAVLEDFLERRSIGKVALVP